MDIPNFLRSMVTGVEVKIYDGGVCVYEIETIQQESKKNDLGILLQNLRDVQSNVNVFLTTLIQRRDAISGEQSNYKYNNDVELIFFSFFFFFT